MLDVLAVLARTLDAEEHALAAARHLDAEGVREELVLRGRTRSPPQRGAKKGTRLEC